MELGRSNKKYSFFFSPAAFKFFYYHNVVPYLVYTGSLQNCPDPDLELKNMNTLYEIFDLNFDPHNRMRIRITAVIPLVISLGQFKLCSVFSSHYNLYYDSNWPWTSYSSYIMDGTLYDWWPLLQCSGPGSESGSGFTGSTWFWASWIRIQILLSSSKTSK